LAASPSIGFELKTVMACSTHQMILKGKEMKLNRDIASVEDRKTGFSRFKPT